MVNTLADFFRHQKLEEEQSKKEQVSDKTDALEN